MVDKEIDAALQADLQFLATKPNMKLVVISESYQVLHGEEAKKFDSWYQGFMGLLEPMV